MPRLTLNSEQSFSSPLQYGTAGVISYSKRSICRTGKWTRQEGDRVRGRVRGRERGLWGLSHLTDGELLPVMQKEPIWARKA